MRAVEPSWPAAGAKPYHATGIWPAVVRDFTQVGEVLPDRGLVMTARGYPYGQAEVELTLAPEDADTRIVMREQPSGRAGFALRNPVVDAVTERRNIEALARLKALVERPAEPVQGS